MTKVKKESEARTFRLDSDVCKKLDEYSEKSMIPKTKIVEVALKEYLEKHKIEKGE